MEEAGRGDSCRVEGEEVERALVLFADGTEKGGDVNEELEVMETMVA